MSKCSIKTSSRIENSLDFCINGGKKLSGEITTNTSKNGAMGLLCASLDKQEGSLDRASSKTEIR